MLVLQLVILKYKFASLSILSLYILQIREEKLIASAAHKEKKFFQSLPGGSTVR